MIEHINNYILEHKINEILAYGLNNNIKCLKSEKNSKIIVKDSEMSDNEINLYF